MAWGDFQADPYAARDRYYAERPAAQAAVVKLRTGAPTDSISVLDNRRYFGDGAVSITGAPVNGQGSLAIGGAGNMAIPTLGLEDLAAGGLAAWQLWQQAQALPPPTNGGIIPAAQLIPGETRGPGVPEIDPSRIVKQWHTKYQRRDGRDGLVYFTLAQNGWIYYFDNLSGKEGKYKPKKPIGVIMQGSNMRMKDFLRIDRYLDRFTSRLAKRSSRLMLQRPKAKKETVYKDGDDHHHH